MNKKELKTDHFTLVLLLREKCSGQHFVMLLELLYIKVTPLADCYPDFQKGRAELGLDSMAWGSAHISVSCQFCNGLVKNIQSNLVCQNSEMHFSFACSRFGSYLLSS